MASPERALEDVLPLTPLQEGLLFHAGSDQDDVYTVRTTIGLTGPVDPDRLRTAWATVLSRYPNLRVGFWYEDLDRPVQFVAREATVPVRFVDLSAATPEETRHELARIAEDEDRIPFDLTIAPPLRCVLVRHSPTEHTLVLTNHHIVLDGWSMPLLVRELMEAYSAGGDSAGLPQAPAFRDHLAWLASRDTDGAEDAWVRALDGAPEDTDVLGRPQERTTGPAGVDRPVDAAVLRASADEMLRRHPNLRAGFAHEGMEQPVQFIRPAMPAHWREVDLSGHEPSERDRELTRIRREERERRFDLTRPPLIRNVLVHCGPGRMVLVETHHHILMDGWSGTLYIFELLELYRAGGDGSKLAPARPYRDYLVWLSRQDMDRAAGAWREALGGLDAPTLVAPPDQGRRPVMPRSLEATLDPGTAQALTTVARRIGVTPNTLLYTAWALTLRAQTGRDDIVFGSTVSGRPRRSPMSPRSSACSSTPSPCASTRARTNACSTCSRACTSSRPPCCRTTT